MSNGLTTLLINHPWTQEDKLEGEDDTDKDESMDDEEEEAEGSESGEEEGSESENPEEANANEEKLAACALLIDVG